MRAKEPGVSHGHQSLYIFSRQRPQRQLSDSNLPYCGSNDFASLLRSQPKLANLKKVTTVLYKKIRLRCTKLYFHWQIIILITPEPLYLALE